jgi:FKBP-type peptidyl-prolyl cis-trans isomerase FkpA
MSLLNRTWILVRACIEAMPFRGGNRPLPRQRAKRHAPLEYLEYRELLAGDVPTVSDVSKTLHLNVAQASYTFKISDFLAGYHDASGAPLTQIVIVKAPTDGSFSLNGSTKAVAAGSVLNVSSIPNLTYFYDPSSTYTGSDVFQWTAKTGSTQASNNANFTLVLPDKAPTIANISKTVQSRTSPRFNTSDFTNVFKDGDKDDTLFQVQILSLPQHGTLTIIGGDATTHVTTPGNFARVAAGDLIPLGQLANLIYTPTPGYTGPDFFAFNARDLEQFAAVQANVLINVTASPALVVTGGGQMIANHSTTTNPANFTDFGGMTTTADSTLGTDTRTFVITNNGNTTINLTGGKGHLIRIGGPQASDFKVTTAPDVTTLAPNEVTTFTVQFAPNANDTRLATITIPNSSGTPYTFAISGTGLITTSTFVSSVFASVDQGTTVHGAGEASFAGEQLTVRYSGFLLNYSNTTSVPIGLAGTVFDSTVNEGGKPFSFVLGAGQVIKGWDAALAGMKVGETRVLMIPASAAYGGSGNGVVPPNASLEFTVTLLKITKPTLVVSGNGNAIKSGDNSPSTTDGTDFGTLPAKTVSSSAHTFVVTSQTGAFVSGTTISVTGADPNDFIINSTPTKSDGTKTFTVTFKPMRPGVRTAVIHVNTGIATNSDYSFTVKGNSSAYTDIVPTLGKTSLPGTVILHSTPSFTVPLTIQNIGTSALPGGASTDVHFFLKNKATGRQISFPQSTPALNVSNLGPGASQTFNLSLKLPSTLTPGTYQLVAVINNKHGVPETLSSNDTIISTQTFTIEPVTTNLTGDLISSTLPKSIIARQPISGTITVNVRNAGNQKMPAGQQITLTVLAKNITTGETTTLTVSGPLSVSNLAGHTSQRFTVPVSFPKGLVTAGYHYEVQIKPVQNLAQSNTADDLIAKTTGNATLSLQVAQPDISATLGNSTLPKTVKAGSSTNQVGTLGVIVTNASSAALPANEKVKIAILAHPTAGGSDITLVPAGTEFSVGSLGAGANTTINVGASFNGKNFTVGNYTLEAKVTLVSSVPESNTSNNLATVNASQLTIGLTATA